MRLKKAFRIVKRLKRVDIEKLPAIAQYVDDVKENFKVRAIPKYVTHPMADQAIQRAFMEVRTL